MTKTSQQKFERYKEMKVEIIRMWNLNTTTIQGSLRMIKKNIDNYIKKIFHRNKKKYCVHEHRQHKQEYRSQSDIFS